MIFHGTGLTRATGRRLEAGVYVEKPVDGSAPFYPMGEEPEGIIMYTPDGYMSAQIMHPGRPKFASGDWFRGTEEEIKEEALGYIAFVVLSIRTSTSPYGRAQANAHAYDV